MTQLFMLPGLLFSPALLGMGFYAVRELVAALALFSVGFAALLLIGLICVLGQKGVKAGGKWLRVRTPQWDRAWRDWLLEFVRSLRWRQLWPKWTHRIPVSAMTTIIPSETCPRRGHRYKEFQM